MFFVRIALLLAASVVSLPAWDYEGHRTVNQLALAGLPDDFPAFAKTPAAAERIAFLAGEPDRWRGTNELSLRHANGPDHFFDIEYLAAAGLPLASLSEFRYVYTVEFAAAHAAHPERFPAIDPAKNKDRTRELIGYLPWAVVEHFARLKSAFSYLRAYEENGTPDEIANARANVIYFMGVLGHYVGDGAQPLHTSKHHNGWVGDNPRNYTRSKTIHAWIDGGFIGLGNLSSADLLARARPGRLLETPAKPDPAKHSRVFDEMLRFIVEQNDRVEPLYQLEAAGLLKADAPDGGEAGRAFVGEQLLRGGEMLSTLWLTAWKTAGPDNYLRAQLGKRKAATATPATSPASTIEHAH